MIIPSFGSVSASLTRRTISRACVCVCVPGFLGMKKHSLEEAACLKRDRALHWRGWARHVIRMAVSVCGGVPGYLERGMLDFRRQLVRKEPEDSLCLGGIKLLAGMGCRVN